MGRRYKWLCLQRTNGLKSLKKYVNQFWEKADLNKLGSLFHCQVVKMSEILKKLLSVITLSIAGEDVGNRDMLYTAGGNANLSAFSQSV